MYSKNYASALARVKVTNLDGEKVKVPYFIGEDGLIHVSAETDADVADYYGEYRGNDPWINLKLVEWAEKRDCHWEWDNPGSIALIEH